MIYKLQTAWPSGKRRWCNDILDAIQLLNACASKCLPISNLLINHRACVLATSTWLQVLVPAPTAKFSDTVCHCIDDILTLCKVTSGVT